MQPIAVNESAGASPLQSRPAGWTHCFALVALFGAGTLLRFHCAACKPFWFDECFSVEVARLDWRNFLHLMWWREANMSLYYLLLRLWLLFGRSPFFIRSLSVLISAATLPAIHWVAKLLYDRRVALIATALLAVNAYSIRYAQEARSYSLFLLLTTLSSGFLISWLRGTHMVSRSQSATSSFQARRMSSYVLTTVLAVYAHFYALLLIPVHWFAGSRISPYADAKTRSAIPGRTWKIIALCVLPLLIFVAKTGAGPIRWIQRPGLQDLTEFVKHFAGGNDWVLPTIFLVACAAAVAPLGRALWSRTEIWEVWRCQFLLLWLLFPIVLTVLLSFARPVFLSRYMIFCLPTLLILSAAGLAHLNRWARPVVVPLVLLVGLRGTAFVYGHDFDTERDASVAASNFILDHSEPGDAIIFHIAETRIPYEFVRSLRSHTNTSGANFTAPLWPEIVFPRHGPELDYRDFTGKPTPELARSAASASPRLWVVLMNNGTTGNPDPTTKMLSQFLPETLPKVQRWQFPKVEVRLYSRQ